MNKSVITIQVYGPNFIGKKETKSKTVEFCTGLINIDACTCLTKKQKELVLELVEDARNRPSQYVTSSYARTGYIVEIKG